MFFFFWDKSELPTYDQLMKPLLMALKQLGEPSTIEEIDNEVIRIMGLSDDMINITHNGDSNRSEIAYRLAWARTYLKKYGLVTNVKRGIWKLSDDFDGNVEDVDVEKIKRSVKNTSSEDKRLSKFESGQAFERLIISLIKDIAGSQNKACYLAYSDYADTGVDLVLPEGIDSIDESIDCVVKYFPHNVRINNSQIMKSIERIEFRSNKLLYITNVSADADIRTKYSESIIIWDERELSKRIDPEKSYTKYVINAKEALIKDAVSTNKSSDVLKSKNKTFIENIRKAFKNEDMSLFLGAGVSLDGGIPLWSTLIKHLHINMINRLTEEDNLDSNFKDMLIELATYNGIDSPLLQMRYIKSAFTEEEYYDLVYSVMYEKEEDLGTDLLNAIAKICTPQRAYCGVKNVVTYNFDDLLESKLDEKQIKFNVIADQENRQLVDKLNIYHVHGFLPRNKSYCTGEDTPDLIFSEEDYHKVYRDSFSWSNLVQLNALRENTCLFIGCSLTDPNLRRLLDVAITESEEPRHYAFMKRQKVKLNEDLEQNITQEVVDTYLRIDDNIQTAYYEQLGINIIWVDEFDEIPKILTSFDS